MANFSNGILIPHDTVIGSPGSGIEFWEKVKSDIVTLSEIIKNRDKKDNGEELTEMRI